MTNTKILHLTTYLQGGAGKVVLDLAKRSKAKGMSVIVGFTNKSVKGYCNYPAHLESLKKASISQIKLPSTFDRNPAKITESAKYLLERFKVNPPDIIHCHAANPSRIALEFRKLANIQIPIIQTMHGWGIYKTPEQEKDDIETFNKIEHLILVSKSSECLLKSKGLNSKKYSIIYNGIDDYKPSSDSFDKDMNEILRLKKEGYFIIGVVGTLDQRKNQRFVLETIKVLPEYIKLKFIFVGEGKVEEMVNLVNSYGISERVNFLGYKNNARELIASFDLLLCPSKSEGFPVTVMEAFSTKTLVLASNIPEHMEAITDEITGFSFESDDISDLKEKIIKIYKIKDIKNITLNSYNLFKNRFSAKKFLIENENIYRTLSHK